MLFIPVFFLIFIIVTIVIMISHDMSFIIDKIFFSLFWSVLITMALIISTYIYFKDYNFENYTEVAYLIQTDDGTDKKLLITENGELVFLDDNEINSVESGYINTYESSVKYRLNYKKVSNYDFYTKYLSIGVFKDINTKKLVSANILDDSDLIRDTDDNYKDANLISGKFSRSIKNNNLITDFDYIVNYILEEHTYSDIKLKYINNDNKIIQEDVNINNICFKYSLSSYIKKDDNNYIIYFNDYDLNALKDNFNYFRIDKCNISWIYLISIDIIKE